MMQAPKSLAGVAASCSVKRGPGTCIAPIAEKPTSRPCALPSAPLKLKNKPGRRWSLNHGWHRGRLQFREPYGVGAQNGDGRLSDVLLPLPIEAGLRVSERGAFGVGPSRCKSASSFSWSELNV